MSLGLGRSIHNPLVRPGTGGVRGGGGGCRLYTDNLSVENLSQQCLTYLDILGKSYTTILPLVTLVNTDQPTLVI